MGFRKLQTKKIWGNFQDAIKTQKHWYITYELSSFFLNLFTVEWEQNREKEKIKCKTNSYYNQLNLVGLSRFLRNKERKVAEIFWRVCQVSWLFDFVCKFLL